MQSILPQNLECCRLRSCIEESCSVWCPVSSVIIYAIEIDLHFKQMVRRTCMILSVRSSHSPPLPFTMPPIPDGPEPITSFPSSMRSALVQTTTIGTPAELWVRVPGPRGNTVLDTVAVAGNGSAEGSA